MDLDKKPQATAANLYQECAESLSLTWEAGRGAGERVFAKNSKEAERAGLVGYFNLIHQNQVQILGATELRYILSLNDEEKKAALNTLFSQEILVVIVADGRLPLEEFAKLADERSIGLFVSPAPGVQVIADIQYYLTRIFATQINLHGVFLEVISTGVLLTGDSGVGKSELALQLVTRGHRLIADDSPIFSRIAHDIVVGSSPPIIKDFLEVRGLGVLDIRQMYGDSSIKASKYLKLIIDLKEHKDNSLERDRLRQSESTRDVLGVKVPLFTLPVAPGRNLAVLVEAAVRNHILVLKGQRAHEQLAERQRKCIEAQESI